MEETERLRISRYFRKVMKLVAKEVLAKKMVSKNDVYQLFEANSIEEEIATSPFYINYKFDLKQLQSLPSSILFLL